MGQSPPKSSKKTLDPQLQKNKISFYRNAYNSWVLFLNYTRDRGSFLLLFHALYISVNFLSIQISRNKIFLLGIVTVILKVFLEVLGGSYACLEGVFTVAFKGKTAIAVGTDTQRKIDITTLDLFFEGFRRRRLEFACFNFVYYFGKVLNSFINAFFVKIYGNNRIPLFYENDNL